MGMLLLKVLLTSLLSHCPGSGTGVEDVGPPVFWMRLSPTQDNTGKHKIMVQLIWFDF